MRAISVDCVDPVSYSGIDAQGIFRACVPSVSCDPRSLRRGGRGTWGTQIHVGIATLESRPSPGELVIGNLNSLPNAH